MRAKFSARSDIKNPGATPPPPAPGPRLSLAAGAGRRWPRGFPRGNSSRWRRPLEGAGRRRPCLQPRALGPEPSWGKPWVLERRGALSEGSRRKEGDQEGEGEVEAKGRATENLIGLKSSSAAASPLRAELSLACVASRKPAPVISLGASHGT